MCPELNLFVIGWYTTDTCQNQIKIIVNIKINSKHFVMSVLLHVPLTFSTYESVASIILKYGTYCKQGKSLLLCSTKNASIMRSHSRILDHSSPIWPPQKL